MVGGPGGQKHGRGLACARKRTCGLSRWKQRKKRQLNIRRESKMEAREVEVAHRTVLIF